MRRGWVVEAALIGAALLGGVPAEAGSASGTCLINLTFAFSAPISNSSGPTPWTMSGSGTCQTTAQPGAAKSVGISGQGGGSLTRCASMLLTGTYTVNFLPDPAPNPSNGTFTVVGTASGGGMFMSGSAPTFLGVAGLAGGGLVACAAGGTSHLSFVTSLTFVDP